MSFLAVGTLQLAVHGINSNPVLGGRADHDLVFPHSERDVTTHDAEAIDPFPRAVPSTRVPKHVDLVGSHYVVGSGVDEIVVCDDAGKPARLDARYTFS